MTGVLCFLAVSADEAEAPWFERAFQDDYRLVYAHRDLESARGEVAWLVEQGLGGRVLDLCCGFGRHATAMAETGLEVFGLDLSMDLLRAAREQPGYERLLAGRLVRADATRLPFRDGVFDSIAVLFSSFGYFGEAGDGRMLDGIARALRPGGLAVLDLMNPDRIRAGLVPHSRREGPGFVLDERRQLEDGGRRVVKHVELTLTADRGETRRWREDVRMYALDELRELLDGRGLGVERVEGDFGGRKFDPEAPRTILFARRTAR